MSEGIPYADIVILALIAGFILLRLRSVLGEKTGNDHPSYFDRPLPPPVTDKPEPIVQLDEKTLKPKREEPDVYMAGVDDAVISEAISAIKVKDPQFTATRFLAGAKGAFEMVFEAFAKSDRQTLKMLLSDNVLREFTQALSARDAQEQKSETTLVSVQAKDITAASLLPNNTAQITVLFVSEQVMVVRNSKGEIVDGDASLIHHVEDHWVFERDTASKNPNWKIIET